MLREPKLCDPLTSVDELRTLFLDDHVHAALIVSDGVLLSVIQRPDLDTDLPGTERGARLGRLRGRVVHPDATLDETHGVMISTGQRRLAVLDSRGRLLGLLCLKRSLAGFCSDQDVRSRATEASRRL